MNETALSYSNQFYVLVFSVSNIKTFSAYFSTGYKTHSDKVNDKTRKSEFLNFEIINLIPSYL